MSAHLLRQGTYVTWKQETHLSRTLPNGVRFCGTHHTTPTDDPWRLSRSHAPGKDDDRRSPHSFIAKRICYFFTSSRCLLQVRSVCVSEPKISSAFSGRIIQVGPVAMPYERWVKFNLWDAYIWRQCCHVNPEGAKFNSFSTNLALIFFSFDPGAFFWFFKKKKVFSRPS